MAWARCDCGTRIAWAPRPSARGSGVARALLERLEAEARVAGLSTLCLEAGTKQDDALRLYRRYGFTDCAAFGAYAEMPPHKIVASIFLRPG